MKYNAVLDVQKSAGGSTVGSMTLGTANLTVTEGQTVFTFEELIGGTLLLFFLDGVKFGPVEAVEELTGEKTFYFDSTDGAVTVLNGQTAGVVASVLYVATGSGTVQDEPVTVQEVKDWCRIDLDDDDAIIAMLISSARADLEARMNVSLVRRTVTANILNQLGGQYLPYGPVVEVLYLKDTDGEAVETDDYELAGVEFKRLKTCFCDDVTIQYTAGYAVLPSEFKNALLCQIAYLYQNRGDAKLMAGHSLEAQLLISKYRRVV